MPTPPRTSPTGRQAGFTLVEAVVAVAILLIGTLALASTSLAVHTMHETDQDRRAAAAALHGVMENIRSVSNGSLEDDAGWAVAVTAALQPGAAPGDLFAVPGLEPWEGEPAVGSVTVLRDETLTDAEVGCALGLPRDLDNDGLVDNADVTDTAELLPVVLRARWRGAGGDREIVRGFYLVGF